MTAASAATPASTGDDIQIRRIATLDEYQACMTLQDDIWGPGFRELVPSAILMVAQKMGGICAGAFDRDDRLVGFVFGLTGVRGGVAGGPVTHWSDMMAVRPEARGARVGERLKAFQRELCLASGITTMYWTFDPVVARNAYLNVMRLGADCAEYVVNMYGSNTGSPLHGALETDRWVAAWDLTAAAPRERTADPRGVFVLHPDPRDGHPRLGEWPDCAVVRVAIPDDHERLSLEERIAWRAATRTALLRALEQGGAVTGFYRSTADTPAFYEITRRSPDT